MSTTPKTATRSVRPVPEGSERVPRTIWSALRGSTPSRRAMHRSRRRRSGAWNLLKARPAISADKDEMTAAPSLCASAPVAQFVIHCSTLGHELRNPLAPLLNALHLLGMRIG